MEKRQDTPSTSTSATASQPSETPKPSQPPPLRPPQVQPKPPSSTITQLPSAPNPSLDPKPSTSLASSQPRPPTFNRTWQQQQSHFSNFSSHLSSSSSAPSLSSTSPSIATPTGPRAGVAIGVPAHRPSPSPQPAPFSSSFGQKFGGLGRGGVNAVDSASNSSSSQVRQPMQGVQGMGMMGSLGSGSQMRPSGVSVHHQQRPVQSALRPSTPNNQSLASQNFQGHGLLRAPSVGSPGSPSPSTSQSMQPLNQPWLSSGSQGKPPLPSPSYRPQVNSQSLQQRSHISQLHHPSPTAPHQHMSPAQPQQPSSSHQPHEHNGQQFPSSRVPQSLPHQQQITRVQGPGNQKPSSLAMLQSNTVQPGTHNRIAGGESDESCNRILSKRSIHELVSQIDPSEKLDPEVEDILIDIADDFVESITTFGCSLAKHRKSSTLEAKDILLHLERNWNMTLPGFSGDEIKSYKKPLTNDIHKERLAAIKKSIFAAETANAKNVAGQVAGNAKSIFAKMPANAMGSANLKIHEIT